MHDRPDHENDDALSADVRELLDTSVDGLDALDALLLLNADPSRWWAVQEIARCIEIDVAVARRALGFLKTRGLTSEAAGGQLFRMAQLPARSHGAFTALAAVCADNRAAVVDYVSSRSMGRLRVLAEAFTRGGGGGRDP